MKRPKPQRGLLHHQVTDFNSREEIWRLVEADNVLIYSHIRRAAAAA